MGLRALSPRHTCSQCGEQAWSIVRTLISERTVHYRRVRVYVCQCCGARLYTHEERCPRPELPGQQVGCQIVRLDVHPCECDHELHKRCIWQPPGTSPLYYHHYVCRSCGRDHWTAERVKGETPEPTPRDKRGRTPHPYL